MPVLAREGGNWPGSFAIREEPRAKVVGDIYHAALPGFCLYALDDDFALRHLAPVERPKFCRSKTGKHLGSDAGKNCVRRTGKQRGDLIGFEDRNIGIGEGWLLDVRRRISRCPPSRDSEIEENVEIAQVIQPGFGTVRLGVEPVFKMVTVDLVDVVLWKSRTEFLEAPAKMADVKPRAAGIRLGFEDGVDSLFDLLRTASGLCMRKIVPHRFC
jgi:hypothetical protein